MEKDRATAMAHSVLTQLNIGQGELHKLADVPIAQWLTIRSGGFSPVLDGTIISQHPFVPGPASYVAGIPLLIGNNRDEATFFSENNPELFKLDDAALVERLHNQLGAERADAVLPVFRRERPNATPSELYIAIATAGMWGGTLAEAESKVDQHGAPVYMYRYDYPSNWPIKDTDWTLRAGHATEIQAKFENADIHGLMGTAPDRFQAARNMGEVWAAFARTGHPKVTGAPAWPAYNLQTRATMLIEVKCTLVNDPNKAEREIWQATTPQTAR
jgi:para-nitrobenzyl esterase